MSNIKKVINEFLDKYDYKNNKDVLAIILYGSYSKNTFTKDSDIDILIIKNDNDKSIYRGLIYINNYKIEWFEKPIFDLYESAKNDFINFNKASLSILVQAKIIYKKGDEYDKLKNFVEKLYSNKFTPLKNDEILEMIAIINNRMEALKKMYDEKNPYFNHLFYLTLEKIRKFYHRINQIPEIQTSKVYSIYTDEQKRKNYNIDIIPNEAFLKIFFKVINSRLSLKRKYKLINKLYEYTKKDLNFNEENFKIKIKSRNLTNKKYF